MLRRSLFLLAFWCALIVSGCGGGDGGSSQSGGQDPGGPAASGDVLQGPGGIVGPPMDAAVRHAAMDRVSARFRQLVENQVPASQRERQLLAFMESVPEFAQTGQGEDGTLWARFPDNVYYVLSTGIFSSSEAPAVADAPPTKGAAIPSAAAPEMASIKSASAGHPEMVNGKKALVLDVFHASQGTPNDEIVKMLRKRGYDVTTAAATLDILRNVKDVSVLYWSSHGGQAPDFLRSGANFWLAWTATRATPGGDKAYLADLTAGRLVYFEAQFGKPFFPWDDFVERRYGITAEGIKHYGWTFKDNSLAFLNFCWSDHGGLAEALRLLNNPASTTLGYTNAAQVGKAWKAAKYFFDRSLGTNLAEPVQDGGIRPFSSADVFSKMVSLGLDDVTSAAYGASKLNLQGTNLMLAPSVKHMEVFERSFEPAGLWKPILVLNGHFGTRPPNSVTINGTPALSVSHKGPDEIHVELVKSLGPGFAGAVRVFSDGGVKSNAPFLTQWHGQIEYHGDVVPPPTRVTAAINVNAIYRGDVHRYRETVDGPLTRPGTAYLLPAEPSSAKWSIDGALPGWNVITPRIGVLPYGVRPDPPPYGTGYFADLVVDRNGGMVQLAGNFLGVFIKYRVPPAPQVFDVVMPGDVQLYTLTLTEQDRFGRFRYEPKVKAALNPDLTTAVTVVKGRSYDVNRTYIQIPAFTVTHGPTENEEEDTE